MIPPCDSDRLAERLRELEFSSKWQHKAALPMPERLAGNPEYLVRIVYLTPTDRVPVSQEEYELRVDGVTRRLRASMEMTSEILASEMVKAGVADVGKSPNFEREADGRLRVIPIKGRLATQEYWGDSIGFNSNYQFAAILNDLFGPSNERVAFQKTIYMIVVDTLTIDPTLPAPTLRGYLGGGLGLGSADQGGYCIVSAGVLDFLPLPATDDRAGRDQAFLAALCDGSTVHQLRNYKGPWFGVPPACGYAEVPLTRAELTSIFQGVYTHELAHSFGIHHESIGDGMMGAGYSRYGQLLREHLGVECPAIPLVTPPNCATRDLGYPFGYRLSISPYFNPVVDPDKTAPTIDIAWPPSGYFYTVGSSTYDLVRLTGADPGGGTITSAVLYEDGAAKDFKLVGETQATLSSHNTFALPAGRRDFRVEVTDRAGNVGGLNHTVFGRMESDQSDNVLLPRSVWARRPAEEDTRPRDASMPLGSFKNPYTSIQEAIDAASKLGNWIPAVVIGSGTWPVASPIRMKTRGSITGEGLGRTILDGGKTSVQLILADKDGGVLQNAQVANLVLRNAGAGIQARNPSEWTYHFSVVNCLFQNLTGSAVDLVYIAGGIELSQNTVYRCGGGIRLRTYVPFSPADRYVLRNNMVMNCSGIGIEQTLIAGLDSNARVGGNLCFGNGINWVGNGSGAGSWYASKRWPGEFSALPTFAVEPPVEPEDFRPAISSIAVHRGLAPTENENGTRRTIGAWLDDFPVRTGNTWMLE